MKRLKMTMLAMSVACLMASATAVSAEGPTVPGQTPVEQARQGQEQEPAEVRWMGVVQAVSGTSLAVDGPAKNDVITGTMTSATQVESKQTHKAMPVGEIRPGDAVSVAGRRGPDGSLTITRVTVEHGAVMATGSGPAVPNADLQRGGTKSVAEVATPSARF